MADIKFVHCLFEQSGTFKEAFRKYGIPALDYDIANEYGKTDVQLDLLVEIERAFCGETSIFDHMKRGELVFAFFPCTYFSNNNMLIFNSASLAEIATTLERMYGVKVVFDSEKLKNVPFSGTIRNSSLHNVFYIISLTYPLTYKLEGDTVKIGSSIN